MTGTEQAEKVVRDLEEQLESLTHRTKLLTDQKQKLSYAAHTGDKNAKSKLQGINTELTGIVDDIEIKQNALIEANARVNVSRAAEAVTADQVRALKVQELRAAYIERLEEIHDACEDIAKLTTENHILLREMRLLGITAPTDEIVRINSVLALKTMLMGTPWNPKEFEQGPHYLAPNQRKYFKDLAQAWGTAIENQIAGRLPPKQKAA